MLNVFRGHFTSGDRRTGAERQPEARLANAGWSYRTNERGWVIYRDPDTGLWHTRDSSKPRRSPVIATVKCNCNNFAGSDFQGIMS